MKTWRWTLLFVAVGSLAFACTVEDAGTDDDSGTSENTTSTGSSMGGSGGSTSNTVASTTQASTCGGGDPCPMMGSFQDCANCYCMADQASCMAYNDVVIDNLFCGATCATDCAELCADPTTMPTAPCNACLDTIDCSAPPPGSTAEADCMAAITACQASAGCNTFLNTLSACPMN